MPAIARTVAIVNHKGGVGKKPTTFCFGAALIELGRSVLLVDTDPQQGLARFVLRRNRQGSPKPSREMPRSLAC